MSIRQFERAILALLLLVAVSACGAARLGAWSRAQQSYADGEYWEAIRRSEQLLGYGTPSLEQRANVYLFQARCYEQLGELDRAIGLYIFVSKTFPKTPHDYQARVALTRIERRQPARGSDGI